MFSVSVTNMVEFNYNEGDLVLCKVGRNIVTSGYVEPKPDELFKGLRLFRSLITGYTHLVPEENIISYRQYRKPVIKTSNYNGMRRAHGRNIEKHVKPKQI